MDLSADALTQIFKFVDPESTLLRSRLVSRSWDTAFWQSGGGREFWNLAPKRLHILIRTSYAVSDLLLSPGSMPGDGESILVRLTRTLKRAIVDPLEGSLKFREELMNFVRRHPMELGFDGETNHKSLKMYMGFPRSPELTTQFGEMLRHAELLKYKTGNLRSGTLWRDGDKFFSIDFELDCTFRIVLPDSDRMLQCSLRVRESYLEDELDFQNYPVKACVISPTGKEEPFSGGLQPNVIPIPEVFHVTFSRKEWPWELITPRLLFWAFWTVIHVRIHDELRHCS